MLLAVAAALLLLGAAQSATALFERLFPDNSNGFVQPKHAPGVQVADFAKHDLPKIRMSERTVDLTSGVNFVSLLLHTRTKARDSSDALSVGKNSLASRCDSLDCLPRRFRRRFWSISFGATLFYLQNLIKSFQAS